MEFNTTRYEADYGRKPRGFGHWAFALANDPEPNAIFWHAGTYAEAKKAARAHFAKNPLVYVLP